MKYWYGTTLALLVATGLAGGGNAWAAFECNAPPEGFETGVPPSGWTVANVAAGTAWTTIAGASENGNYTNGSGGAATASSDGFGWGGATTLPW